MEKCPDCGTKYYKYDIRKQRHLTIAENFKQRTIQWKNMLKMDIEWILVTFGILMMCFGFINYAGDLQDVRANPCGFCAESGCMDYVESYDAEGNQIFYQKDFRNSYFQDINLPDNK